MHLVVRPVVIISSPPLTKELLFISSKRYTTDVAVESFEFIGSGNGARDNADSFNNGGYGNSSSDYSAQGNNDSFGDLSFNDDITPVDDGDMPF